MILRRHRFVKWLSKKIYPELMKRKLRQELRAEPDSSVVPRVQASRPRIQDVALLAGVSLGTVSAVLNLNGRIGEGTRAKVQEAIQTLDYRPDLYASNMARRQTQVLGVIISNLQNPFFAETAQAIEEEAAINGYQISLMATNFRPEQLREAVRRLLGSRLAGLAVLTSEHDEVSQKMVLDSGLPSVFLDIGEPKNRLSILRVDSRQGMQAAVNHLIDLGHRKLLYIRNSQQRGGVRLLSHRMRDQGFAAAVRASKAKNILTRVVDVTGAGADAGEKAVSLAWKKEEFTAIVATTDLVAMGVYRGLQMLGLRTPEEVSIVGFDNTYFSRFLSPPLTTVDVPRALLSQLTVRSLIDGDPGRLLTLNTELVIRDSTGPPCHC